ncbi:MAG: YlmC/YmxH family sporulation protein [Bacillota bacterium]|nr:YlmC/YmxH family sporulation protein [Bacillota bacterium]
MRLSEFADKRIINIFDGDILGIAGDSDLLIEPDSGRILEIIVPAGRGFGGAARRQQLVIPWSAVKKVGSEVIVVELEDAVKYYR